MAFFISPNWSLIIFKNACLPSIFFCSPIALAKICFSRVSNKTRNKTFVLAGTPERRRPYAQEQKETLPFKPATHLAILLADHSEFDRHWLMRTHLAFFSSIAAMWHFNLVPGLHRGAFWKVLWQNRPTWLVDFSGDSQRWAQKIAGTGTLGECRRI